MNSMKSSQLKLSKFVDIALLNAQPTIISLKIVIDDKRCKLALYIYYSHHTVTFS